MVVEKIFCEPLRWNAWSILNLFTFSFVFGGCWNSLIPQCTINSQPIIIMYIWNVLFVFFYMLDHSRDLFYLLFHMLHFDIFWQQVVDIIFPFFPLHLRTASFTSDELWLLVIARILPTPVTQVLFKVRTIFCLL